MSGRTLKIELVAQRDGNSFIGVVHSVVGNLCASCNFFFVFSESLISYENTGFKSVISQHTHTFWLFPLSHPLILPHSRSLSVSPSLSISLLTHFSLLSSYFACDNSKTRALGQCIIKKFAWTFERSAHFWNTMGDGNGLKNEPKHHRKPFAKSLFLLR